MSITGFGFDKERAREMLFALERVEAAARVRLNEACGREVSALSVKDLGKAFFAELRAPVFFRSELTGRPSLGVDAMRGYAACADPKLRAAALATLDVRRARKIRSTYVMRPLASLAPDERIHPTWNNCGPVSGRWSCQDPNLQNLPRADTEPQETRALGGIRGLYIARDGHTLVAFDAKQLEMRVAAYASGDAAMIQACESRDLHGANAAVIFGAAFDAATYALLDDRKGSLTAGEKAVLVELVKLRTLAKSAGFAVCYMASAETVYARIVASGVQISLRAVEAMLAKLRRGFATYFAWQEARRLDAIRTGYTDEPITGRRRWLGHDPSSTECANHPIQGGAAGLMNVRLPEIVRALRARVSEATLVAQVHDAGVFELPEAQAEACAAVCREVFEQPILLRSSGLRATFPIDIKVGRRWK
jgi:DNA polymerase-1